MDPNRAGRLENKSDRGSGEVGPEEQLSFILMGWLSILPLGAMGTRSACSICAEHISAVS